MDINNIVNFNKFNINSLIYFLIVTLIVFVGVYSGSNVLKELTTEKVAYIALLSFWFFIYIVALGLYFFHWNFTGISAMLLLIISILSIICFLIILYGNSMCEGLEKVTKREWLHYLLTGLLIIVFYLGFYNHSKMTSWDLYDTIRFILMLTIIRVMYYIVYKYEYKTFKSLLDLTSIVVIVLGGRRLLSVIRIGNVKMET